VKLRAWFEKMEYPLRLEIIFLEYPLIRCQKSLELVLSSIFFPPRAEFVERSLFEVLKTSLELALNVLYILFSREHCWKRWNGAIPNRPSCSVCKNLRSLTFLKSTYAYFCWTRVKGDVKQNSETVDRLTLVQRY
jgi:hypothetical protein